MLLLSVSTLDYNKHAGRAARGRRWRQKSTLSSLSRSRSQLAELHKVQWGAMQEDMPYLHTALAETNPELQQACLFPTYQQLALFAEQQGNLELSDALELFAKR